LVGPGKLLTSTDSGRSWQDDVMPSGMHDRAPVAIRPDSGDGLYLATEDAAGVVIHWQRSPESAYGADRVFAVTVR
jgi:hypothetical protein